MNPTDVPTPVIWRTKLRSDLHSDHLAQENHCFENGIVGIGWPLRNGRTGARAETAIALTIEQYGAQAAGNVRRIAIEAKSGDFIWTRNKAGMFRLGQFGDDAFRYDASAKATATDIHQVRNVSWAGTQLADIDVPGAVIRAFSMRGQSFSRIKDTRARQLTGMIWDELQGNSKSKWTVTPESVLATHLPPYDLEDLVYVWMQIELGYVAIPNSRRTDTAAYEWTMVHPTDGHQARIQIKTGDAKLDLDDLRATKTKGSKLFAFSSSDSFVGSARGISKIKSSELIDFARDNQNVLPPRVRRWFDRAA